MVQSTEAKSSGVQLPQIQHPLERLGNPKTEEMCAQASVISLGDRLPTASESRMRVGVIDPRETLSRMRTSIDCGQRPSNPTILHQRGKTTPAVFTPPSVNSWNLPSQSRCESPTKAKPKIPILGCRAQMASRSADEMRRSVPCCRENSFSSAPPISKPQTPQAGVTATEMIQMFQDKLLKSTQPQQDAKNQSVTGNFLELQRLFANNDSSGRGIIDKGVLTRVLSTFIRRPINSTQMDNLIRLLQLPNLNRPSNGASSSISTPQPMGISFDQFFSCVSRSAYPGPTKPVTPRQMEHDEGTPRLTLTQQTLFKQIQDNDYPMWMETSVGSAEREKRSPRPISEKIQPYAPEPGVETPETGDRGDKIINRPAVKKNQHARPVIDVQSIVKRRFRAGCIRVQAALRKFDKEDTGMVTEEEFINAIQEVAGLPTVGPTAILQVLRKASIQPIRAKKEGEEINMIPYRRFILSYQDRSEAGQPHRILADPSHAFHKQRRAQNLMSGNGVADCSPVEDLECRLMGIFQSDFLNLLTNLQKMDQDGTDLISETQLKRLLANSNTIPRGNTPAPGMYSPMVNYVNFLGQFDARGQASPTLWETEQEESISSPYNPYSAFDREQSSTQLYRKGDADLRKTSRKLNSDHDMVNDQLRSKMTFARADLLQELVSLDPNQSGWVPRDAFKVILAELCIHLTDGELELIANKFSHTMFPDRIVYAPLLRGIDKSGTLSAALESSVGVNQAMNASQHEEAPINLASFTGGQKEQPKLDDDVIAITNPHRGKTTGNKNIQVQYDDDERTVSSGTSNTDFGKRNCPNSSVVRTITLKADGGYDGIRVKGSERNLRKLGKMVKKFDSEKSGHVRLTDLRQLLASTNVQILAGRNGADPMTELMEQYDNKLSGNIPYDRLINDAKCALKSAREL